MASESANQSRWPSERAASLRRRAELAHVVRDDGADRLRRLPRLAPLGRVVARAEDAHDRVVVDRLAAELAAVLRVPSLDRGLELDDAAGVARRAPGWAASRRGAGRAGAGRARLPRRRPARPTTAANASAIGEEVGARELCHHAHAARSPPWPRRWRPTRRGTRQPSSGRRPASSSATTAAGAPGTRESLWTRCRFAARVGRAPGSACRSRRSTSTPTPPSALGRVGLVATGALYLLLGLLSLRVALEGRAAGHRPDTEGALQLVADQPFGRVLLGCSLLGFAAHAVWRLAQALRDRDREGDAPRGSRSALATRRSRCGTPRSAGLTGWILFGHSPNPDASRRQATRGRVRLALRSRARRRGGARSSIVAAVGSVVFAYRRRHLAKLHTERMARRRGDCRRPGGADRLRRPRPRLRA